MGICGAFGYLYGQDARPDYQLVLMSIAQAENDSRSFVQRVGTASSGVLVGKNVVLVM